MISERNVKNYNFLVLRNKEGVTYLCALQNSSVLFFPNAFEIFLNLCHGIGSSALLGSFFIYTFSKMGMLQ